jgi:23S rRNA pseudouridine1911/1915/1917 synthase
MKITVTAENNGERLDKFLTDKLPTLSRSQIQKLIKNESIVINGTPAKAHSYLAADDEISILNTALEAPVRETSSPIFDSIIVIDEQPDYLVINKPAGLIIHEAPSMQEATLVDWLVANYPEIKTIGENPMRPGIVHRIDKDVSGLLIVARTEAGFKHFKKLFQNRTLKKIYTAITHDVIKRDDGVIDFPIERAAGGYRMAAKPKNQEGKPAETHFTVLKRFLHFTLVEILIKTGRTHQIRAHLSAYGNPIVGDNLYGTHTCKLANRKLGTKRIFLMASRLEFKDPTGEKKKYELELPKEFTELMETLK